MSKITVAKAVSLGYTSQATIYRDMRTGAISYERNGKNRRLIDVSELSTSIRRTENTSQPNPTQKKESDNSQTTPTTHIDKDKIITVLEAQVTELKEYITAERAEKVETA